MKSRIPFFFLMLVVIFAFAFIWGHTRLTQAASLAPQGATISVTTLNDTIASDGLCSLREAILSANTDTGIGGCIAGDGSDTIILASGNYQLSILGPGEDSGDTGDLDITDSLVIQGNGSATTIISANFGPDLEDWDRIFHIAPDESDIVVTMYDLTIENGDITYKALGTDGDIRGGGGVLTNATLILDSVVVKDNNAQRGGGVRVTHLGSLEIQDSTIQENTAEFEGGGLYGDGPISLDTVMILNNEANRGGGIYCDQTCTLTDITISQNQASLGGGVYNDSTADIQFTTVNINQASLEGGGIYSEADLNLTNVTVSGNTSWGQGSAMYSNGIADLANVTIYQNQSLSGGTTTPGLVNEFGATFTLVNTIIDNSPVDCSGIFQSFGSNIASDVSCFLTHDTDLQNTNPRLQSFSEQNGGPTGTHLLLPNSPAIDAGNNSRCTSMDQRGYPRPVDGNGDGIPKCDIGSVELSPGGIFRMSPVSPQVEESVGTIQFTVVRDGSVEGDVSVSYLTWESFAPNWAVQNVDFIRNTGTLYWADGNSYSQIITIEIVDDTYDEPDEEFFLYLTNPTGGSAIVDSTRQAVITILEDESDTDPAPPNPVRNFVNLPLLLK